MIKKIGLFAIGTLMGSVVMYALDPVSGRKRRERVYNKANKYKDDVLDFSEKKTKEYTRKAKNLKAEAQSRLN